MAGYSPAMLSLPELPSNIERYTDTVTLASCPIGLATPF